MRALINSEYRARLAKTLMNLGDHSSECYVLLDVKKSSFSIIYCNEAYMELTGFKSEEVIGQPIKSFLNLSSINNINEIQLKLKEGSKVSLELFHVRKNSFPFHAQIECFPMKSDDDVTEYIMVAVKDITYKKLNKYGNDLERKMFRAIQKEKTFFEKLILSCEFIDKTLGHNVFSTIVIQKENDLYITSALPFENSNIHLIPKGMANNYYKALMGLSESKVFSSHKGYPLSPIHQQYAFERGLNSCWQIPIPISKTENIGLITIFFAVQERQKEFYERFMTKVITLICLAYTYDKKQQEVYRLAYTDIATGLPNRHDFMKQLEKYDSGYILFVEPSEYSKFVDLYGRAFGDEMIKQLANKFMKQKVPVNFVAHFSTSTIAMFLKDDTVTIDQIRHCMEEIAKESCKIFGNEIYLSLKVGAEKIKPNISKELICQNADNALSSAKEKAGTQFVIYDEKMQESLKKELLILNNLVEAIQKKQFEVYFQPKIELYRGRVSGMEALVRWNSPVLGNVSPGDFIPIAEQAGLIIDIDLIVFEEVLKWMQKRQYEGKKIVPVSINISPDHFYQPNFIEQIKGLVQKYYADPHFITIEVTESISLVNMDVAKEILFKLRTLGFNTSVDDFGTGFSSLSYLQSLSFSEIKFDRSFIKNLHEPATQVIVNTLIQMAHLLEIITVAEGIETKEQYDYLKKCGCDIVQGFYLYRPMSMGQLEEHHII